MEWESVRKVKLINEGQFDRREKNSGSGGGGGGSRKKQGSGLWEDSSHCKGFACWRAAYRRSHGWRWGCDVRTQPGGLGCRRKIGESKGVDKNDQVSPLVRSLCFQNCWS